MEALFKALSDETRLRLLNLLLQSELCVCDIEAVLGISQTNASRHLAKLKQVGLIGSRKTAQWVYYRVLESSKEDYHLLYDFLKIEFSKNDLFMDDDKALLHQLNQKTCAILGGQE